MQYSSDWFPIERVKRKRRAFLRLVKKLAEEQSVELDKQVDKFLSGHLEGSRARTTSTYISPVPTIEKDGVILLESDTEDGELEITTSRDSPRATEDQSTDLEEALDCTEASTVKPLAPGTASPGPVELPESLLGSLGQEEDPPRLKSIFQSPVKSRIIVEDSDDDDFAGDLFGCEL